MELQKNKKKVNQTIIANILKDLKIKESFTTYIFVSPPSQVQIDFSFFQI